MADQIAPAASAALAPASCAASAGSLPRKNAWYSGIAMFQDRMLPDTTTIPMLSPTI